jgi:probable HAF family extracellular repeat protein
VVVGTRTGADDLPHATRWTAAGVVQDLDVEGFSWANDVNDHGNRHVAETAQLGRVGQQLGGGARLDHEATEAGVGQARVADDRAVNERGAIAGYSNDETSGWPLPVLRQGRRHTPAVVPGRRDNYDVTGINERGMVVGYSTLADGGQRATVFVPR